MNGNNLFTGHSPVTSLGQPDRLQFHEERLADNPMSSPGEFIEDGEPDFLERNMPRFEMPKTTPGRSGSRAIVALRGAPPGYEERGLSLRTSGKRLVEPRNSPGRD
jgi:hypothetical protein